MSQAYHVHQPPLLICSKVCKKCGIDKPLDEFLKHKECRDGHYATCTACFRAKRNKTNRIPARATVFSKVCTHCGIEKPLNAFYRAKRGKNGRDAICKQCTLAQRRIRENWNPPRPKPKSRPGYKFCTKCGEEKPLTKFVAGGSCKDCKSIYDAALYQEQAIERRARQRTYAHSPEGQAHSKAYYQANYERHKEAVQLRARQWAKDHPERRREQSQRRNALKRGVTIEDVDYMAILERDGCWCYICEQPIDPTISGKKSVGLSFDHEVPLQPRRGEPQGTHSEENIHPAHRICNTRKNNIPFELLTAWQRRGP